MRVLGLAGVGVLLGWLAPLVAGQTAATEPLTWRVSEQQAVELWLQGQRHATTPSEGLWSIGTGWKDGWPAEWQHARPTQREVVNEWTLLSGSLAFAGGELLLRDGYRLDQGLLHVRRRWEWRGKDVLRQVTLTARWQAVEAVHAKSFLPGISFYGNPSGARHAGTTVVQTGAVGERSYLEEHRYPLPFASLEWSGHVLALHTLPSLVPGAHRRDQWWSLGVETLPQTSELALLSGPCAANGRNAVAKARQDSFMAYDETWMDLRPGAIVEKEYALQLVTGAAPAHGFRKPLATALQRAQPLRSDSLPKAKDILASKLAFARTRWREGENHAGFEMYPDFVEGTHYVMGWAGQAEAVPWALLQMEERIAWPDARATAVKALDTLAQAPFDAWGFAQHLHAESRAWTERDPVSQGQALESFTRAVEDARAKGMPTKRWDVFVVRASTLQAERMLAPDWRAPSTAECFLVSPLLRAARLYGDERFAQAALRCAEEAARRHISWDEPYWGGTLDARCEDKEGCWAGFQAFLAAHDHALIKQDAAAARLWLERAAHALDATLSWTMTWDVSLPAGRLADHAFRSRGWTVVSAQNQHLDVYGVLYTPEIWRMGELLGRPELKDLAKLMFRSCGQLLDEYGSAGEQLQHTNFAQAGDMSDVERMRGGYSEGWTVFWITAHFLHALARFDELGVTVDELDR